MTKVQSSLVMNQQLGPNLLVFFFKKFSLLLTLTYQVNKKVRIFHMDISIRSSVP